MRLAVLMIACLSLAGRGLVALAFRVTGDVLSVAPVIGTSLGALAHAMGDVID